jgi:hypothetical protein
VLLVPCARCAARCHPGTCYQCTETRSVACACDATRLLVPCGRERDAQPPKCKKKCRKPTECHHQQRQPHNCHFGSCPTCKYVDTSRNRTFKSLLTTSLDWRVVRPCRVGTSAPPCATMRFGSSTVARRRPPVRGRRRPQKWR